MANEKKYSMEEMGIIAVLSVIGFGFLAMLVALIRTPETAEDQPAVIDPIAAVLEERSHESVRNYNKPLAIHSFSFQTDPYAIPDVDNQHDHLVPDAPDGDSWPRNDFGAVTMPVMPGPVMRQNVEEDEEDALTGESKDRSGWGWLADDIMTSRKESNPGSRKSTEDESLAEQEDQEQQDEMNTQRLADRKQGRELMGQSVLLDMETDRDSLMSPLLEMDKSRDNPGNRADDESGREGRGDEQAGVRGEDSQNQEGRDRQSNALEMRDPFARNTGEDRSEFGSRDWQFGENDSSVLRPREDAEVTAVENSQIGSIGSSLVDVSGRIVGDASSDASRLSSGWSGYASDSIFNGGGGYTPQGVQAVGSEPLFSGAGVFGGGVGSVVGSSLDASSGGISPIGGSSFGGLPASGSSLGESSFGDTPKQPSALPW